MSGAGNPERSDTVPVEAQWTNELYHVTARELREIAAQLDVVNGMGEYERPWTVAVRCQRDIAEGIRMQRRVRTPKTRPEPGTRFVLNDNCGWVQRRGCSGVVVAPPPDGTYPQPGPGEVVVVLDCDPLGSTTELTGGGLWTCCTEISTLDVER